MKFFADRFVKPYLAGSGYVDVCEIGASLGENSDRVLEVGGVKMTLIDPCYDAKLETKFAGNPRVMIRRGLSLDVLPVLDGTYDAFLIDGDHNWYTVYNELKFIKERNLLRPGGTLFFHDVDWPYDRRDLYYDPSQVPPEFRQPYAKKGIFRGQSALAETGGANAIWDNALHAGGPRNGVLTAIEDFWNENRADYDYFQIDLEQGLGVMIKKGGSDRPAKTFAKFRGQARWINLSERVKDVLKPSRRQFRAPRNGVAG